MRSHKLSISSSFPFILSLLIVTCHADVWDSTQDTYLDAVTSIPECGLDCVLRLTPGLNNSCLSTDSATTCFCEGDIGHYIDVLNCVQGRCTIEESIETARGAWEACGKPQRSRKPDMLGSIAVEGPALICVLLRFFSRWWTLSRFEVDDYIMMVVTVG
ncbi:hypothetical protein B0T14DRAFT_101709 [Immersiella caudata]|uniref:CFEM domain-containing protein n=1 Tax=Immersiella caudata TaxID=314043 RepID=A0AA40C634_9PEZI|nr:hypothetical protein B0T14DRAFT_101709 [Immersiella caudata]